MGSVTSGGKLYRCVGGEVRNIKTTRKGGFLYVEMVEIAPAFSTH